METSAVFDQKHIRGWCFCWQDSGYHLLLCVNFGYLSLSGNMVQPWVSYIKPLRLCIHSSQKGALLFMTTHAFVQPTPS